MGFCCFPRFLFCFCFPSFPLHGGGMMTFKKGVLRSVLARRWLSVRAGVAVRVYVPAPLSSKYLHQTGNEIIQHPCARTHIHTVWRVRTCLFIERPLIHLSPGRIRALWDILGPVFLFSCFFTLAFQQHNSFSSTTPPQRKGATSVVKHAVCGGSAWLLLLLLMWLACK